MSRFGGQVRLGKENYTVRRQVVGATKDVYGRLLDEVWEQITVRANIQGSLIHHRQSLSPTGDISKDAISIRSNQRLYKARIGTRSEKLKADQIFYDGAWYEVRDDIHYKNLSTRNTQVIAVRLDEQPLERK
jgi:hypothetical protein